MSPSGKRLYVANWVDNALSEIGTNTMKVVGTVDLNAALAGTKLLGDVAARPALAHRAPSRSRGNLNGRDDDERPRRGVLRAAHGAARGDGSNADTSMQGIVYKLNLWDRSVQVIPLAPLPGPRLQGRRERGGGLLPEPAPVRDDRGRVRVRELRLRVAEGPARRVHRSREQDVRGRRRMPRRRGRLVHRGEEVLDELHAGRRVRRERRQVSPTSAPRTSRA